MQPAADLAHGVAVAVGARGVLIRGPSGAGKSDLACRLVFGGPYDLAGGQPIGLVADDQVILARRGGQVIMRAPPAIAGKIEIRGLGITDAPMRSEAILVLVVDAVAAADVPRLPEADQTAAIGGLRVPLMRLDVREPAAPLKVLLALKALARNPHPVQS